jgi:hypothetical protein
MSRLVAIHFIPNPKNKRWVEHIDGDRSNINYKNIRWSRHTYIARGKKANDYIDKN